MGNAGLRSSAAEVFGGSGVLGVWGLGFLIGL